MRPTRMHRKTRAPTADDGGIGQNPFPQGAKRYVTAKDRVKDATRRHNTSHERSASRRDARSPPRSGPRWRPASEALAERGVVPGLAAVLVGDDPASAVYVRNKGKAAGEAGIASRTLRFAADLARGRSPPDDRRAQPRRRPSTRSSSSFPSRPPFATQRILEAVDPVEGRGRLPPRQRRAARPEQARPAPVHAGRRSWSSSVARGSSLRGMRAVVVGRSDIVGKPMANLLMHADATVTVAHSKTRDLPAVCREADLLVAAMGKARLRDGRLREGRGRRRRRRDQPDLRRAADRERFFPGDAARRAEFEKKGSDARGRLRSGLRRRARGAAARRCPGGVGPLTIAMLLANTLDLARRRRGS